ncbi:hypothetical protein ACE1SV_01540 [Streptomyces sp. E-15]
MLTSAPRARAGSARGDPLSWPKAHARELGVPAGVRTLTHGEPAKARHVVGVEPLPPGAPGAPGPGTPA